MHRGAIGLLDQELESRVVGRQGGTRFDAVGAAAHGTPGPDLDCLESKVWAPGELGVVELALVIVGFGARSDTNRSIFDRSILVSGVRTLREHIPDMTAHCDEPSRYDAICERLGGEGFHTFGE